MGGAKAKTIEEVRELLKQGASDFWPSLSECTRLASDFNELIYLSNLRKRAIATGIEGRSPQQKPVRLAIIGGYNFYPLHELLEHTLTAIGIETSLWVGDFDNYAQEIIDETSELYRFAPEVVLFFPAEHRLPQHKLTESMDKVDSSVQAYCDHILSLCRQLHARSKAEIVLANFILPGHFDPGSYRTRTPASDWNIRKSVNMRLGLQADPFVQICDLELLAYRRGWATSVDHRAWFETKQPCSADLLCDIAKEAAHLITNLKSAPKKVLVLDLDNTLWGGVIGDDGLAGIEIGGNSSRAESFRAFQRYIASLGERGVLLAVCSKNDESNVIEAFVHHPDMVLKREHFAAFKCNWEPKSDNIRAIANELSLSLEHFVFVDDNPAEIEIVNQFLPEVSTILLTDDPSEYATQLADSRFFEPRQITAEDLERTRQYQAEQDRKAVLESATDMQSYLKSLQMVAEIHPFNQLDLVRVTQLVNKTNQFNLTTRRRTESELNEIINDPSYATISVRLSDRFGDHGLIGAAILKQEDDTLEIDTLLMSCRVLNRNVEHEIVNEIISIARRKGCATVRGTYIATPKNKMVSALYPSMGFAMLDSGESQNSYEIAVDRYKVIETEITKNTEKRTNEPS